MLYWGSLAEGLTLGEPKWQGGPGGKSAGRGGVSGASGSLRRRVVDCIGGYRL